MAFATTGDFCAATALCPPARGPAGPKPAWMLLHKWSTAVVLWEGASGGLWGPVPAQSRVDFQVRWCCSWPHPAECLQGWRCFSLSRHLFLGWITLKIFFSSNLYNFPCCCLCLLPLLVCCAPSRRVWLHHLCNCLLVSGRLQLGLFSVLQLDSQPLLSWVLQPPDHTGVFLLDLLHFLCPSYTGQLKTGPSIADMVSKALCKVEGSPVLTHWLCCSPCSPGCCWFALLQGCIIGSCSACCPPGHQGPFLQNHIHSL